MKNYIGNKFGKLLIINQYREGMYWFCGVRCDCGRMKNKVYLTMLKAGKSRSCGCARRRFRHENLSLYYVWAKMKSRCSNKNDDSFKDYGGRGIRVCERWLSYENFFKDMYPRPIGHSLNRVDNNGNYEPSNCEWATDLEQQNNKRNNVIFEGKTMAQWARTNNIDRRVIYERLKRGWDIEKAMREKLSK